ncbi:MAG: SusD/RagB family nutrient-binding outer membrane lipoprotein, partial [Muribaculaceae bacterium]|nr:SusD/RagB family nutrient-binding outer membrane lipoprotein [Muribaculaceae bacterium]
LTLAKIMTQKHMAMMFSVEQFNDMRRYDYDSNVFLNWEIPAEYYINETAKEYIPEGKHLRRWRQCSHEYNYNSTQLIAIGPKVPGAKVDSKNWNMEDDTWTILVWWDSDQE